MYARLILLSIKKQTDENKNKNKAKCNMRRGKLPSELKLIFSLY